MVRSGDNPCSDKAARSASLGRPERHGYPALLAYGRLFVHRYGVEEPRTCYATSGDVSIAYQVTGDGPFDLVWVQGFISHVELAWDNPALAALNRRLSSFCRLIRFDKRGTGMSDRVAVGDLETRMDDVRAVMDAVGSSQAALFGSSEGGPMSILFAATYPERVFALALWSTFPRWRWAPDYEFGLTDEQVRQAVEDDMQIWADPDAAEEAARQIAPGLDDTSIAAFARGLRQGASPGSARALIEMSNGIDVRQALPAIGAPTLAAVRSGDDAFNRRGTRYIAERIPGARYVELPGSAHAPAAGRFPTRALTSTSRTVTCRRVSPALSPISSTTSAATSVSA
jgi:pimeloyl-ACP methyl ester carboxylesterase